MSPSVRQAGFERLLCVILLAAVVSSPAQAQRRPRLSKPASPQASASAPAPSPSVSGSYVALGDSYSAGAGAGDLSDGNCRQAAAAAWPTLLAQRLGLQGSFALAACSGFTSADVLNKELSSLSPSTTLVTVTAGGNDVGVEQALSTCVQPDIDNPLSDDPSRCQTAIMQSQQATTQLGGPLDALFQRIRQLAPSAQVYVVGYPNIIPTTDCEADSDLSTDDIAGLRSLVDPLDTAVQQAVIRAGAGFAFVDMRPAWLGHEVCGNPAWVNGIELTDVDGSYHPNADGQNAYVQVVGQAIAGAAPAPAPSAVTPSTSGA